MRVVCRLFALSRVVIRRSGVIVLVVVICVRLFEGYAVDISESASFRGSGFLCEVSGHFDISLLLVALSPLTVTCAYRPSIGVYCFYQGAYSLVTRCTQWRVGRVKATVDSLQCLFKTRAILNIIDLPHVYCLHSMQVAHLSYECSVVPDGRYA